MVTAIVQATNTFFLNEPIVKVGEDEKDRFLKWSKGQVCLF